MEISLLTNEIPPIVYGGDCGVWDEDLGECVISEGQN